MRGGAEGGFCCIVRGGVEGVMLLHPWDFKDCGFFIYWDSFAHPDQLKSHGAASRR